MRGICINKSRDSWAVFARVSTWLCEVFGWLPIGQETPERYLHVFSCGSARYLHGFQKVYRLLNGICTCFHVALRGICMASKRSRDSWAVFVRVFTWLCIVFAWLPINFQCIFMWLCVLFAHVFIRLCEAFAWLPTGLNTPEQYLHVFSHGSARYLHGFQ